MAWSQAVTVRQLTSEPLRLRGFHGPPLLLTCPAYFARSMLRSWHWCRQEQIPDKAMWDESKQRKACRNTNQKYLQPCELTLGQAEAANFRQERRKERARKA